MKKIAYFLVLFLISTTISFATVWQKMDLTKASDGSISLNINRMVAENGKLYAATFDGIWVSPSGNGGDWEAFGLQGMKVTLLNFGVLKLATVSVTATDDAAKFANKMYKYDGANWVLTNLNPTTVSTFSGANAAFTQIQDAGDNTIILYPTWGYGIWRSADGGTTWTTSNTGLTSLNVLGLFTSPGSPVVYGTVKKANAESVLAYSSDYGLTWTCKLAGTNIFNPYAALLRNYEGQPYYYFAGEGANGGVLRYSSDEGDSFTPSTTGGGNYWQVRKIMGVDDGPLYAMVSVSGVFVSIDNGVTFNAVGTGITVPNPIPQTIPETSGSGAGKFFLSDMVKSATKLYVSTIMTEGIYYVDLDVIAPSTPLNVNNSRTFSSKFTLKWSPSTDNVGVSGYKIYLDGIFYASTLDTSFVVEGLSASTAYTVTVKSKDAECNSSDFSAPLLVTTAAPDDLAPTVPDGLSNSTPTASSFTLRWAPSLDAGVGVDVYTVYKNGVLCATTADTSVLVSGLTANTAYTMTVKAMDGNGNVSALSSPYIVTTAIFTSLSNVADSDVSINIYPNPVKNDLKIDCQGEGSFEIVNLIGQVIYCQLINGNTLVQTTGLQSGVYLLKFKVGSRVIIKKFIKE